LFKGEMRREVPTLVRIHSQCLTGDVFGSTKCDCGPQLHRTMQMIQKEGRGAIVYQQQEGRGIGILNKIRDMHFKTKEQIQSRLTSSWHLQLICVSTNSVRRFYLISVCARCE